jgi:hypothetical protein
LTLKPQFVIVSIIVAFILGVIAGYTIDVRRTVIEPAPTATVTVTTTVTVTSTETAPYNPIIEAKNRRKSDNRKYP